MVVLCTSAVEVKKQNNITREEYAEIHFVKSFCNVNHRAAMVDTDKYAHFAEFHNIRNYVRTYIGVFGRLVLFHEGMQNLNTTV